MNKQSETRNQLLEKTDGTGVMGRPEDVLNDRRLTTAEKRAILAGWASDAHTVEGLPALRQLDDGSIVNLDEILGALRSLDEAVSREGVSSGILGFLPRRHRKLLARLRTRSRHDDDDDPPPSPVTASIPVHFALADAVAA